MGSEAIGCFFCGNPVAPHGFGHPGPRKDLPEHKRGILFVVCEAHKREGEERRAALVDGRPGRSGRNGQDAPPGVDGQGSLGL